jgi:hypothetical protein
VGTSRNALSSFAPLRLCASFFLSSFCASLFLAASQRVSTSFQGRTQFGFDPDFDFDFDFDFDE